MVDQNPVIHVRIGYMQVKTSFKYNTKPIGQIRAIYLDGWISRAQYTE